MRTVQAVARGFLVVLVLNAAFLALVAAAQGDTRAIVDRIRDAFESGDLTDADYLSYDARRGYHQYNDCNVLQMVTHADAPRLTRALAPAVFHRNENWDAQCAVLREVVVEGASPQPFLVDRYARYWHGYAVVAAFGLRLMPLHTLRRTISAAVWAAIAGLAVLAIRARAYVRRAAGCVAVTAATVWAVPYFAPGFTHGPGDLVVLLGILVVAAVPRLTARTDRLIPFAAGFGAMVTFFEMLTAQLPIAAAWLAVVVLAARRDESPSAGNAARAVCSAAVIAFAIGAALTVVVKQLLAAWLVSPSVTDPFLANLGLYVSVPAATGAWPGIVEPLVQLWSRARVLTLGNDFAGQALLVATSVLLMTAAGRAWREARRHSGADIALLCGVSLVPIFWSILLPTHTSMHAAFMVRMLVVPISLAPIAIFWPQAATSPTAATFPAPASKKR